MNQPDLYLVHHRSHHCGKAEIMFAISVSTIFHLNSHSLHALRIPHLTYMSCFGMFLRSGETTVALTLNRVTQWLYTEMIEISVELSRPPTVKTVHLSYWRKDGLKNRQKNSYQVEPKNNSGVIYLYWGSEHQFSQQIRSDLIMTKLCAKITELISIACIYCEEKKVLFEVLFVCSRKNPNYNLSKYHFD